MPASPASVPPRTAPTAAMLIDMLLQVHRQSRLSGILESAAAGLTRLGLPVHVGALLRDGGSNVWYLAALMDAQGKAVSPARHGIPDQPLNVRLPQTDGALPLPVLFGGMLDPAIYDRMATNLGVGGGICLPVLVAGEPRGAVFGLFASPESGPMVSALFAHIALSAARVLEYEPISGVRRVLGVGAFADAAETELARCSATGRQASLIVCAANSNPELAALGRGLLKQARPWDICGRAPADSPAVALLLPEVDRVDARLLLRRVNGYEHGGVAVYPDEGTTLARLITVALSRTTVGDVTATERENEPVGSGWIRGLRVTPHADVLRCPGCNLAYTRLRRDGASALDEQHLTAVRSALEAACPEHGPEVAV